MALDLTTNPTGLFFQGGRFVKAVNARQATAATDLPAEQVYVTAPLESANTIGNYPNVAQLYAAAQQQQVQLRQQVAGLFNTRLADPDTVLTPLGLTSASLTAVLAALDRQMVADAQTVLKCGCAIGAVAAGGTNVGNGTVLLTPLLDGYSPPTRGGPALLTYPGRSSELMLNETHLFACTADAGSGTQSGGEIVAWSGGLAYPAWDWRPEGSGPGPSFPLAGQPGLSAVDDGGMENWGGTGNNTPSTWTIPVGGGTAGTHVFRESSTPYRGSYAAKFTGDGSQATISLTQPLAAGRVQPLRMYCLTLRLKASATVAAGAFAASLTGTGYTPGGTESIAVAAGSLPTSWTLKSCFILTPATLPGDLAVTLSWTGTPTAAKSLWLDDVFLTPVNYFGGVGAVGVPGSTPMVRGDRWTAATTNDFAGKFQTFFRRQYGVQLPSAAGGANTINDALAT